MPVPTAANMGDIYAAGQGGESFGDNLMRMAQMMMMGEQLRAERKRRKFEEQMQPYEMQLAKQRNAQLEQSMQQAAELHPLQKAQVEASTKGSIQSQRFAEKQQPLSLESIRTTIEANKKSMAAEEERLRLAREEAARAKEIHAAGEAPRELASKEAAAQLPSVQERAQAGVALLKGQARSMEAGATLEEAKAAAAKIEKDVRYMGNYLDNTARTITNVGKPLSSTALKRHLESLDKLLSPENMLPDAPLVDALNAPADPRTLARLSSIPGLKDVYPEAFDDAGKIRADLSNYEAASAMRSVFLQAPMQGVTIQPSEPSSGIVEESPSTKAARAGIMTYGIPIGQ